MFETVLIDTSAWIALFDPQSEGHEEIVAQSGIIEEFPLVIPWPIVYETLRTRFTRRPIWVSTFKTLISRPDITFVDDSIYREDAFALTFDYATIHKRDISMVDMLCRLIIDDPNVRVDYVMTLNRRDFFDVCSANGVEIIP